MHITLFNNPVCQIPGYRHFLVNSLPTLKALDNYIITDEERIEDASFGYRFRALNEFMKLHIPDYSNEALAEQHLLNLEVDVYRLKRIFERNSPSIIIQSFWRGSSSRNISKGVSVKRSASIVKVQAWIRATLARIAFQRELRAMLKTTGDEDLLMTNDEIIRRDAARTIFEHMWAYHRMLKRHRRRVAATLKIQTFYRMRFVKNSSFIKVLEIE
jgi:hypothetical protein